jgi:ribosomal protein S18 acetylase RimI-like enzyme
VHAIPLGSDDEAAIEELLQADPVANLFLLALLDQGPALWPWYGVRGDDERLVAVAVALPTLVVPYATDPAYAAAIGVALRSVLTPDLLVGPRDDVDALLAAWTDAVPAVFYDQRLYVLDVEPAPRDSGVRRAGLEHVGQVAELSAAMDREDLGRGPADARVHRAVVTDRIVDGRTWIAEREGRIVFLVHVGTRHHLGCQVGGTYVHPAHRGQGLATACMADVGRALLARHPLVTLHVNEANLPAVRVYEKVGFRRARPFRLAIVPRAPTEDVE